jgi:hypothetical protein
VGIKDFIQVQAEFSKALAKLKRAKGSVERHNLLLVLRMLLAEADKVVADDLSNSPLSG